MSGGLRYHPEARRELIEAAQYYEGRERGLGSRFLDEIERSERFLLRNPEIWPADSRGRRKQPVHVFPYSLIYRIESGPCSSWRLPMGAGGRDTGRSATVRKRGCGGLPRSSGVVFRLRYRA